MFNTDCDPHADTERMLFFLVPDRCDGDESGSDSAFCKSKQTSHGREASKVGRSSKTHADDSLSERKIDISGVVDPREEHCGTYPYYDGGANELRDRQTTHEIDEGTFRSEL